jgi:WD40 repeat protein
MIAKEPANRYQEAADVTAALTPLVIQAVALPAEHEMPRLSPAAQGTGPPSPPPTVPGAVFAGPATEIQSGERGDAPSLSALTATAETSGPDTTVDSAYRLRRTAALRWWLVINVVGGGVLLAVSVLFCVLVFRSAPPPASTLRTPDVAATPSPAQAALKLLSARVSDPAANAEQLRRDLLAFPLQHPGTPESMSIGRLLAQVRSPLDQLNSRALPEPLREDWRPLELVGVVGSVPIYLRHPQDLRALAFHPDGKQLASGGKDGIVYLWDITLDKPPAALKGHTGEINSVCFAPDGATLASAGDQTVRLWDVAAGKERAAWMAPAGVNSLAIAPDGKTLASSLKDGSVLLWDVAAGKVQTTLRGHTGEVWGVAFSADGRTLATGGDDHALKLWDVASAKEVRAFPSHPGAIWSVPFSPDGKTLVSAGQEAVVRLWDLATGKQRAELNGHTSSVWAAAFTRDGQTLATGSYDRTVKLWDVGTAKERATLGGHTGIINVVALSADGRTLASGGVDRGVRLWDVPTAKAREMPAAGWPGRYVEWIHEAPDGRFVAIGKDGAVLKLWDALAGKELVSFPECRHTYWPGLAPDGQSLVSYDFAQKEPAQLWDATTGKARPPFPGQSGGVGWGHFVFGPDGKTLAGISDGRLIRFWDAHTSRLRATLPDHPGGVNGLNYSPDGATLASAGKDGTARLWDVATGAHRFTLAGHKAPLRAVLHAPDGRTFATMSEDGTTKLWDLATRQERAVLPAPVHGVRLYFSPDGKAAVMGVNDGMVHAFDVKDGAVRQLLAGHDGDVYHLAFSPDGRLLLATTTTGHTILWHLPTEKKLHEWRLPNETYAHFTADGRHLIAYGNGTAYILRLIPSAK